MKKTTEKENYLKALYKFEEKSKEVSVTALSEYFKVSKSTVSNMIKKLVKMGFVDTQPYKAILLTDLGRTKAIEIISKHRLIELYLVKEMHFELDEVHDIAEEIEHINSNLFFDRMDEILGFPTLDPHGSPIPDKNGKVLKVNYLNLSTIKPGQKVRLCGLENSSKDLLLYLNKKKIKLGSVLSILHIEKFDNSFEILLENNSTILLTFDVCLSLLVEEI